MILDIFNPQKIIMFNLSDLLHINDRNSPPDKRHPYLFCISAIIVRTLERRGRGGNCTGMYSYITSYIKTMLVLLIELYTICVYILTTITHTCILHYSYYYYSMVVTYVLSTHTYIRVYGIVWIMCTIYLAFLRKL